MDGYQPQAEQRPHQLVKKNDDDVIDQTHSVFGWTVRENRISVDEWCSKVRRILALYAAPPAQLVSALREAVDIQSGFFWGQTQRNVILDEQLRKKPSESWWIYLDRLRSWCSTRRMCPDKQWFLDTIGPCKWTLRYAAMLASLWIRA